jgi:uncharacterized protein YbjT (DUF2867 family)
MQKKILVIGGTGTLGEPVARRLKSNGFQVRIFTRSIEKARAHFGTEYQLAGGDVEDSSDMELALQGCQGVHISLDGGADPDLERRAAENTAREARKIGVERITYLSGASVCEENCWFPGTRARFQAEQALQSSGIPYTVFRAHFFMETLPRFIRGRLALHIGKHPFPYYWVAAEDYAGMVARAYAIHKCADKILYVCGPQALTMHQALQIFCRIVHPEAHHANLSIGVASFLARLGRRKDLRAVLPFFDYCEKVKVILSGSPVEANTLLGAPGMTLEEWSNQQIGVNKQ